MFSQEVSSAVWKGRVWRRNTYRRGGVQELRAHAAPVRVSGTTLNCLNILLSQ